jgi:O-antigen ligase
VVALFIIPSWDRRRRLATLKVLPLFLVGMRLMIPGLLGTITSLFTNISNDPSTKGRTDDYAAVGKYITLHPLFGRGFRTFIPSLYRFLDNQYLMTIVDAGLIGLALLLLTFMIGIFTARGARRRIADPARKDLSQAVAASVGSAMVSFATFDALSFPMCGGLLFLLIGIAGAMWRLSGQPCHRRG